MLHKNGLRFFMLNNGTGTIKSIDIVSIKVYDTNMEPVPIISRGVSYNRENKTLIGTGNTTKYGYMLQKEMLHEMSVGISERKER